MDSQHLRGLWSDVPALDTRAFDRVFSTLLGVLAGLALIHWLTGETDTALALGFCVLLGLGLFVLAKRGYRRSAATLVLVLILGLLSREMAGPMGLHNIALIGYPAVVILAGMLLAGPWFVMITVLAILALGAITYGEVNGWLVTKYAADTSYSDLVTISCVLVTTAVFVRILAAGLRESAIAARRNELALKASEERARALVENISEVIVVLDSQGKLQYISPATEKVLGYKVEERIGRDGFELVHPEDVPRARQAFEEALSKPGTSHRVELRMRHKDGGWRSIAVTGRTVDLPNLQGLLISYRDVTDRKRMLEALRESSERLRLAMEAARMGIWEWDAEAGRVTWEEHLYDIFGMSASTFSGTNEGFLQLVHPEDRDLVLEAMRRTVVDDAPYELEFRTLPPDGEVRWMAAAARVERDDEGRAVRMVGVGQDVTRRKRAEEALRASEEKFSKTFNANPHPMSISSLEEAIVLDVNESFLTTFRRRREEVIGRTALEIGIWSDIADRDRLLEMLEERGSVRNEEFSFRMKDGEERIFLLSADIIDLLSERRLLIASTDITKRKQAEEVLRESERKFFQMFHANPSAMSISSVADGRLLEVNESMLELSGWSREEILGRSAAELQTWVDPEERERVIETLEREGKVRGWEARIRTKGGGVLIWVLSAEITELEKERCVLWSATDVTETRKLAEQLQQSQKLEAMGRLAGGVAHDFNNWLTPIIGYSQLVLDGMAGDDPRRNEILEIRNAGERAADLASRLLRFSRSEMVQPRSLDLNEVVTGMGRLLRRVIGEDIDLTTHLAPKLARVEADAGQIEQVIMNLAVNARDAMPAGGDLTIETENVDLEESHSRLQLPVEPGPHVMIAVSDTGYGMDAETAARIFEPFFTTKDESKGTGLGLSIVYGIVKQNGGEITVYSEVGKGTTFKIYLPRVDVTDREVVPPVDAVALRGRETVLLVEDQPAVRAFAVAALRGYDYEVLVADGGESALELSQDFAGEIDVLVTDVVMPRMSGLELATRLVELRPSCRLVYVSGYTGRAVVRHGGLDPAAPLLHKPFTGEALARAVREALARPN